MEIYENDNIPLPNSISGKKYSGKFQLRIDSELHKALSIMVKSGRRSLSCTTKGSAFSRALPYWVII
jgi:predicted HicB family RNase H-like nuclease